MNVISKNDLLQAIKDNEKKNHPISLDFNFENDDIVDTLLTLFNNKEKYTITKILSVLTKYKVSIIEKFGIGKKYMLSVDYWKYNGWDENVARERVLNITRCETIFTKNDLIKYITSEENPLKINLENREYVNHLIEKYTFETAYTHRMIKNVFDDMITDLYKEKYNTTKKFKNTNIEFYIARGFDKEYAVRTISKIQTEKNYAVYGSDCGLNFSNETINQIINEIESKKTNKTKASIKYWKKLGLGNEEALQRMNENKDSIILGENIMIETIGSRLIAKNNSVKRIIIDDTNAGVINLLFNIFKPNIENLCYESVIKQAYNDDMCELYVFNAYVKIGYAQVLIDICDTDNTIDYEYIIKKDPTVLGIISIDCKRLNDILLTDVKSLEKDIQTSINKIKTLNSTIEIIK